ncbi:MAG: hypothetical protein KDI98_06685 [Hyphomicrobiaceae bacterium]|nr:hypothetical protein [Hyphomicrobiaceae bacterium]
MADINDVMSSEAFLLNTFMMTDMFMGMVLEDINPAKQIVGEMIGEATG